MYMKSLLKIVGAAIYCSVLCNLINWGFVELIALFHSISTFWSVVLFVIVLFLIGAGGSLCALLVVPLYYLMKDCKAAHYLPILSIVICGLYSLSMPWVFGVSSFGVWYWILHISLTIMIFLIYYALLFCVIMSLVGKMDE